MATTISGTESRKILGQLIRKEFDRIDPLFDLDNEKSNKLIQLALKYGLIDEANKMKNDKI